MNKSLLQFDVLISLLFLVFNYFEYINGAAEIKSYPSAGRVSVGESVTLTCSLGEHVGSVDWVHVTGSLHSIIVAHDVTTNSIEEVGRYQHTTARRDGMVESQLVISDARPEDTGRFGCKLTTDDKLSYANVAVCERGVDSDSCKCMLEHGQMLSTCFEDVSDVRAHYKRITTGLIVCLVLVFVVGVGLAVLVGKDCLVDIYRSRKKKEEDEASAAMRARRESRSSGGNGKGLIYRGLGRASMLGRGNGARSKHPESARLNVDEPDRYSNTSSSHIEVRTDRQSSGGAMNGAYMPDDSTDRSGFHHLPKYQGQTSYGPAPSYNSVATTPTTPRYPQLNASSSEITSDNPISVIGRGGPDTRKPLAEFPGARGIPEGKPSSVASDPPANNGPSDHGGRSAFKPVKGHVDPNHQQQVQVDYHRPPVAKPRKGASNDWLSSTSGWHDDDDDTEYDPSMDIEKSPPQRYNSQADIVGSGNVLLTPASLGDPRTPPSGMVPSPRGAYSEAPPTKRNNNDRQRGGGGAGVIEPRQLSYEDKNRWRNNAPYVSSNHSNV